MLKQFLLIAPVFVAGLVLGLWARGDSAPAPEVATETNRVSASGAQAFDQAADHDRLEEMITSLNELVSLEVAERRRLEEEVAALREEFTTLRDLPPALQDAAAARRAAARESARRNAAGVTVDRFVEAGFSRDRAELLKQQLDEIALERLFLRDKAVREGWLNSQRYREELTNLNGRRGDVRESLGDDDYDRYLYATGRPNRIVVNSVLRGSPADEAGLEAGDRIVSYDTDRIFTPGEIRRETTRGSAGAMVPVEVVRDGERLVVYLPRGPLGVQMSGASEKP